MPNLLTLLIILENLFTVTLPQSISAPVEAGELAQMENYGTTVELVPILEEQ